MKRYLNIVQPVVWQLSLYLLAVTSMRHTKSILKWAKRHILALLTI